jgi:hypothetical protein
VVNKYTGENEHATFCSHGKFNALFFGVLESETEKDKMCHGLKRRKKTIGNISCHVFYYNLKSNGHDA